LSGPGLSAALSVADVQTGPVAGATFGPTKVRPTDRDELFVKSIAKT